MNRDRSRRGWGNYVNPRNDRSSSSFGGPSAPPHRTPGNYGSSNDFPLERKGDRKGGLSDDGGKNPGQLSVGSVSKQSDSVLASDSSHEPFTPHGIAEASSRMGNLRLADDLQTPSFGSNFEVDFPLLSAPSNTKDKYTSVKGQQSEQAVDALGKSHSKSSQTVDSSIRHGQASHEKTDSSGKLETSQILHPGVDSGIRQGPASHEKADGSGKSENSQILPPGVPFDICVVRTGVQLKTSLLVRNREKRNEIKRFSEGQSIKVLRPGMVLLSRYLSIGDQVKITQKCRELGLGPGGFYQPGYRDGAKLNLKMMCLGKNWDPQTSMYGVVRPIDGAKPPAIPDEFYVLVQRAIQDSHAYLKKQSNKTNVEAILPSMTPDICIVNFYTNSGRLGLHQDKDESEESLRCGLPVVSFSIGDSGEFVYGDQRDIDKAEKVILESGDVLIFGGESRHVFHGVTTINADTAPKVLLEEANLRAGRLNLTFRQYSA